MREDDGPDRCAKKKTERKPDAEEDHETDMGAKKKKTR